MAGLISESVIRMSETYIGKTENGNDAPWLRAVNDIAGNPAKWNPGESYCIAVLCALFKLASGQTTPFPIAYSKGTQQFWMNAVAKNFTSRDPQRGDIFIMRVGNTAHGHAGIVTAVFPDRIETVEFNTSDNIHGDQRNGGGCFRKIRKFADFRQTSESKLWLRGYVMTSQL